MEKRWQLKMKCLCCCRREQKKERKDVLHFACRCQGVPCSLSPADKREKAGPGWKRRGRAASLLLALQNWGIRRSPNGLTAETDDAAHHLCKQKGRLGLMVLRDMTLPIEPLSLDSRCALSVTRPIAVQVVNISTRWQWSLLQKWGGMDRNGRENEHWAPLPA